MTLKSSLRLDSLNDKRWVDGQEISGIGGENGLSPIGTGRPHACGPVSHRFV
jgi:hypothetical protein